MIEFGIADCLNTFGRKRKDNFPLFFYVSLKEMQHIDVFIYKITTITMNKINGLYGFNFYHEQKKLVPPLSKNCSVEVKVNSDKSNIITISDKGLLAKLGLNVADKNGKKYLQLIDKAHKNAELSSVEYPSLVKIKGGKYNADKQQIELSVVLLGDKTEQIAIDVADLVHSYKAGQGIAISKDTISVALDAKKNKDSQGNDILTLSKNGLGINLSDTAKKSEVKKLQCAVSQLEQEKQDKLTAGEGLQIKDNVISLVNPELFKIVQSLDEVVDPKENIIYLVPAEKKEEKDIFIEYIWVDGAWEKIGEFNPDIDLSDYYKKEEVDALLEEKASESALTEVAEDVEDIKDELAKIKPVKVESTGQTVDVTFDEDTNTYNVEAEVLIKGEGEESYILNHSLEARNKREFAIGDNNLSVQEGEEVEISDGKFEEASGSTIFSVGNGDETSQKNAFEVRNDGSVWMWIEGEYMDITLLLAQLAHEEYM